MFRKARHSAYRDDDPRIVLALRYATEPQPGPWGAFLTGYAVYSVIAGSLMLGTLEMPEASKPPERRVQRIFIPARRARVRKDPPPRKALISKAAGAQLNDPVEEPPVPGRVDLNAIQISLVEDEANEIPEVIRQQFGEIALVERNDPATAHYVFKPPYWQMSDEIQDVSGMMRIAMIPTSRWALLQSLASSHSISMEKYEVDALFDGRFIACLERQIRKKADETPNAGRVLAALLIFSSSGSCGINVVNLEFTSR